MKEKERRIVFYQEPIGRRALTRRSLFRHSGLAAAGALAAGALGAGDLRPVGTTAADVSLDAAAAGAELQPCDAHTSVLAALNRYPLVALGERHLLQEMHDFYIALLLNPALPSTLTDIVVEFGNAMHQDVADRFILGDQPVGTAELAQMWRFTIGGDILWDAPIYERFFRAVRAVNWMRPATRRIRVLLGDPPFDHLKVRGIADKAYVLAAQRQRDTHYADVVEREVLGKGRRALLIAGANHLLRGLRSGDDPKTLNAAGILTRAHPGTLYMVDALILPAGSAPDPLLRRAQRAVAGWRRPVFAPLAGTWLGETTQSVEPWINSAAYLAATPEAVRYGAQADAVLYLGPGETLTASQADPSLYEWGSYPEELRRVSRVVTQIFGEPTDLVAEGLRRARLGPDWFAQYASSK